MLVHKGYKVPYQLHCPPVLLLGLELDATEEATELTVLLAADDWLPLLPQTAPLTVGFSALPPFLLTWKPNSTVWPG